ncbi:GCG_CRPN prefix-to-repeats domain-containing protein [Mesorhizobium sp. RIZ17]|uniref:GCG_CRPN prefix-to-repeats domain-containing protein n=1 Tax=Mesorhizobium sp. RIZ17 TaxID=3132743 RepID=UPI003DA9D65A
MNRLTKYSIAAALAIGGTAAASAASAMPIAPVAPAPAMIEHVAWGCGPGWHPNHWGRCVPNRRVVYPGYYYWGGPRVYIGPAWHPYHHWRRW